MTSVDVPVALLGYGNVGAPSAAARRERGRHRARDRAPAAHRARARSRPGAGARAPRGSGVLTTDFARSATTPRIALVAELMGGLEPAGTYVLELLRAGKPVVSANKQLVARRGAELFAAASESGVQLRFEASVCAAIPVIKVLRESLVATNVHRVLGIVNGTTNYVLIADGAGRVPDALAEASGSGSPRPTRPRT